MNSLKEKIRNLPQSPGVYLWKNKTGQVIYVGKAKDLRKRVAQYFGQDSREQIPYLMKDVADIDYTVASSELESLFLENTLIKQYLPQYNLKLRDDKNYAFIAIDYAEQIPQITYARKVEKTKHIKYFGPYSSAYKMKQTLDFVRKVFPYCSNKAVGKRPCFYYFLHRCPGVCIGQISSAEYHKQLGRIALFLGGKTSEIKRQLQADMQKASGKKQFEVAARLRDSLRAIEILNEKQIAMFPQKVTWDFVSVYKDAGVACINLFKVREGRLIDKENFIYHYQSYQRASLIIPSKMPFDMPFDKASAILQIFLEQYYADASDLPREVYIQYKIENELLINQLLKSRAKRKIKLRVPSRGKKLQIINLGATNAKEFLKNWQITNAESTDVINQALEDLKHLLKLPVTPLRIEGYDISNTQGTNPVGSMVVFKNGLPAKTEYRKFKIKTKQTPNDFAMMEEMLARRLSRISTLGQKPNKINKQLGIWPKPNLIVIDGGKGQLGVAVKLLKEHGLNIPVIGLAKRIEEIFLPRTSEPILLKHNNPTLQLLQRLRDEAHRFGITFHRQLRSKQAVKSALDQIPGIGPKTKKLLKVKFGTVEQIRKIEFEELSDAIGKNKAELLKRGL